MGEKSRSTLDTHSIEMADITDDNLPSINDFKDNSEELPSIKDFLEEKQDIKENSQTIEDAQGNPFLEVTDVVKAPEWIQLVGLIN